VTDSFNSSTSPITNNGTASPNASLGTETGMTMDYVGINGSYASVAPFNSGCTAAYSGYWCNNGLMQIGKSARIRDCTDGTSNTMIIGEQSGLINNKDYRSSYYGGWSGYSESSNWGTGVSTIRYSPNPNTAPAGGDQTYAPNTVLTSPHEGGVQVLLADGSCRFISENMDINTLLQIGASADGQVVGEF
jgi:hypothetical protein